MFGAIKRNDRVKRYRILNNLLEFGAIFATKYFSPGHNFDPIDTKIAISYYGFDNRI
jgi:hypothetical protein